MPTSTMTRILRQVWDDLEREADRRPTSPGEELLPPMKGDPTVRAGETFRIEEIPGTFRTPFTPGQFTPEQVDALDAAWGKLVEGRLAAATDPENPEQKEHLLTTMILFVARWNQWAALGETRWSITIPRLPLPGQNDPPPPAEGGSSSSPGDSTPGDSTPGDSTLGESSPGDSTPGESSPGDSGDSRQLEHAAAPSATNLPSGFLDESSDDWETLPECALAPLEESPGLEQAPKDLEDLAEVDLEDLTPPSIELEGPDPDDEDFIPPSLRLTPPSRSWRLHGCNRSPRPTWRLEAGTANRLSGGSPGYVCKINWNASVPLDARCTCILPTP